jgi:hypothetical protein
MNENIVSIAKRKKSKIEHVASMIVKSDTPTGDYKDALLSFFLSCAERDGIFNMETRSTD